MFDDIIEALENNNESKALVTLSHIKSANPRKKARPAAYSPPN